MRLEHVNLTVADMDRSVAFYTRLFDIAPRWEGHTAGGSRAIHLGTDAWYLALFEGAPGEVPINYTRVGYNHFGVVVDDLEAMKARVEALGGTIHMETDEEPGKRAYCYDPDGFEIEMIEYPA